MIERPQRSGSLVQSQGTYLSGYWNGWSFQVGRHKNDHRQRGRNTCYRHPFESVAETNIKALFSKDSPLLRDSSAVSEVPKAITNNKQNRKNPVSFIFASSIK